MLTLPTQRSGRSTRIAGALGALVLALSALSACANQQFTQDHRIHITSPKQRAKVTSPLTISWTYTGFTPKAPDGSRDKTSGMFAVFVDTAPVKAGKSISRVIHKDAECVGKEKTCLSVVALANHDIYLTTKTSITIPQLPAITATGKTENHDAILVLVDGAGYRIGESAWHISFRSAKRSF